MTSGMLKKILVATVLAGTAAGFASPAMARHWHHRFFDYYGTPGAPGARWNPMPPVGHASSSAAARHNNCPTGTYRCY